ncbi:hypothetical protein ES705_18286 [subsurface metagenome]
MKDRIILKVGDHLVMLKQISFRVFRRLHLAKNSKYLCYYDGQNYYKFKKVSALPAIERQIILFCKQELTIPEETFIRKMGFLPVYFYNNILLLDDVPEDIRAWFLALNSFLNGEKNIELPSSLGIKYVLIDKMGISKKGQRETALVGRGSAMLNLWLFKVIEGRIPVKICEEQTCERIFIPSRNGDSKTAQRFCSDVHRRKALDRRNKAKISV